MYSEKEQGGLSYLPPHTQTRMYIFVYIHKHTDIGERMRTIKQIGQNVNNWRIWINGVCAIFAASYKLEIPPTQRTMPVLTIVLKVSAITRT